METMSQNSSNPTQRKNSRSKWPIFLAILLLSLAWVFFGRSFWLSRYASSEYQSVFLDNGQVYFGKLTFTGSWLKLTDVFYLQVTDPLQNTLEGGAQGEQNIQLIKLGAELHGPEDEMYISKNQVLFWENMKDGAKVLQSIKDYKLKTVEEKP